MRAVRPVAGVVATVLGAAWLALVEVFWLPFRLGGLLVPLSVFAAVAGNVLLVGVAWRTTGSRLGAALPALVWLVVAVAAMSRRPEGDLVIISGGAAGVVNLAFLLLGVVAATFAVGRTLGSARRPADPAPAQSGAGGRA